MFQPLDVINKIHNAQLEEMMAKKGEGIKRRHSMNAFVQEPQSASHVVTDRVNITNTALKKAYETA